MKKAPSKVDLDDQLRPEYDFDYSKARPNRFSAEPTQPEEQVLIVLDPDVARVFTTPEAVNTMLHALIQNMPQETENAA